jgi:hypothetical protein
MEGLGGIATSSMDIYGELAREVRYARQELFQRGQVDTHTWVAERVESEGDLVLETCGSKQHPREHFVDPAEDLSGKNRNERQRWFFALVVINTFDLRGGFAATSLDPRNKWCV